MARHRGADRARLGALLFPEPDEAGARNNLRQRLFQLRKKSGVELVSGDAVIEIDRGATVELDGDGELLATFDPCVDALKRAFDVVPGAATLALRATVDASVASRPIAVPALWPRPVRLADTLQAAALSVKSTRTASYGNSKAPDSVRLITPAFSSA